MCLGSLGFGSSCRSPPVRSPRPALLARGTSRSDPCARRASLLDLSTSSRLHSSTAPPSLPPPCPCLCPFLLLVPAFGHVILVLDLAPLAPTFLCSASSCTTNSPVLPPQFSLPRTTMMTQPNTATMKIEYDQDCCGYADETEEDDVSIAGRVGLAGKGPKARASSNQVFSGCCSSVISGSPGMGAVS